MSLLSRISGIFRSRALDADLDAELRSHIEMRTEMNVAEGMSPEEARRDALLRFGNRAAIKEETRNFAIIGWLESASQDVRYAFRMFRKSPVFTAVALITLTLGIGGNTVIFTLTDAMLLRSLAVPRPDQLARLTFSKPERDFGLSGPMFDAIKNRQHVYSEVFAWSDAEAEITQGSEVRRNFVGLASGDTFKALGIEPVLGRTLRPEDDHPGGGPDGWAGMLAYDYWVAQFGGDRGVLGRNLVINNTPVTIVGVLPRGFRGVELGKRTVAVLPLEFEVVLHPKYPNLHRPLSLFLTVMGRLKPDATLEQAREEIGRIGPGILRDTDSDGVLSKGFFGGTRWGAEPGRTGRMTVRSRYREPLLFVQGLVGLILLICCANVAGLMLARSSARRHEFAVRSALGASRSRMIRQLCIEGGLIALAGAALSLAFARLASQTLVNTLMGQKAVVLDLSPDRGVLLFTTAVAVLATIISALPAAIRATRTDPVDGLQWVRTTFASRSWAEAALVGAQVGISAVLLVAAGLLAGSLHRLLTIDPGFRTAGELVIGTDFSKVGGSGEERTALYEQLLQRVTLYEQLLQRVAALPGVKAVSAESVPMLSGATSTTEMSSVLPDGSIRTDDSLYYNTVGPNYFAAAGTQVIAGRDVQVTDRRNAPSVCWVNQSAAAFFFPASNPVGQVLTTGGKHACQIAGVTQDVKYRSLRETPRRIVYWPFMQAGDQNYLRLLVHTDDVEAATAEVRRVLHDMTPTAPLLDATTVRELLEESIGAERVTAMLAMFFGALALLLAAVGVYGLLSYQVVRQTREIGIRLALGATRGDVLRFVIRRAAGLTGIGLVVGLTASVGVARLLTGLLFEIKPFDPAIYAITAAVLLGASVIASYLPAHRAARVDPVVALRYE